MNNCILKKFILSQLNKLLADHAVNINKTREQVNTWLARAQKITNCLCGLSQKLEDAHVSEDEIQDAIDEITALVKEW